MNTETLYRGFYTVHVGWVTKEWKYELQYSMRLTMG